MNNLNDFDIGEGCTKNELFFNGCIQRHHFTEAIEFYSFDFKAKGLFKVFLNPEIGPMIYIGFNLADKTALVLNFDSKDVIVPPFASAILLKNTSEILSLQCEPQTDYDFLILKIQTDHLSAEQRSLFHALKNDNDGLDVSKRILMPNLELCEMARKLKSITKATCENKFIAQGYCNILIGLKIKGLLISSNKMAFFQPFEIHQLKILSDGIIENPHYEYTIKALCKRTGLSVSKLQSGFKEMHKCTVAIFIRNQRLEKALDLLKNTNMNVTEIVYSVGLTSRSYFCRIFKQRFKCSPKFHQQNLKESLLLD